MLPRGVRRLIPIEGLRIPWMSHSTGDPADESPDLDDAEPPLQGGSSMHPISGPDGITHAQRGDHLMADEDEAMGPVSYLIVEFPGNKMTGEGFAALVDLVDRGLIRILDLVFVTRRTDGSVAAIELRDLDHDGQLDLTIFEGASSGLLDQTDFDDAAEAIQPGSSASIVLFENRWATAFVQGLRRGGAELVAAGYIPLADIAASLDAAEAS
jgi:Family of unknown function (DUF6325)